MHITEAETMTLSVVDMEPHAVIPEHSHPHEQIGYMVQGEVEFMIGGGRHLGPDKCGEFPAALPTRSSPANPRPGHRRLLSAPRGHAAKPRTGSGGVAAPKWRVESGE